MMETEKGQRVVRLLVILAFCCASSATRGDDSSKLGADLLLNTGAPVRNCNGLSPNDEILGNHFRLIPNGFLFIDTSVQKKLKEISSGKRAASGLLEAAYADVGIIKLSKKKHPPTSSWIFCSLDKYKDNPKVIAEVLNGDSHDKDCGDLDFGVGGYTEAACSVTSGGEANIVGKLYLSIDKNNDGIAQIKPSGEKNGVKSLEIRTESADQVRATLTCPNGQKQTTVLKPIQDAPGNSESGVGK